MSELTPVAVEAKLRSLVTELSRAQKALADTRDVEVEAKHTYESQHRAWLLSDDCPAVTRGGVTTAERDAWVAAKVGAEQHAYAVAEAARKAAEDHLRVVRDQASVVQTLARSVQQAYSAAGA